MAERIVPMFPHMYIAYALDMSNPANDQEIECADLDEALLHLRELIESDMEEARYYEEPMSFDRYGVRVTADFNCCKNFRPVV